MTLSRYVVPCITEGVSFVTDYKSTFPTACQNNDTHEIDADKIYIFSTLHTKSVTINQDSSVETGGYYRADQFEFNIPGKANSTASYDISYPYNIGVYSVTLLGSPENIGDSYNIVSHPDTPAGLLSKSISIGDTTLVLPSVVLLNPGFNLSITDGNNTNDLGCIVSLDIIGGIITFSNPPVNSFDAGSAVLITVPRVKNGKFVNSENLDLGFSKIGSAGLPAGNIIRINYINTSDTPKTLNFVVELQF